MLTSQDVFNKRPNFMTPIELSSSVVHVINGIQNSLIGRGVDLGLVIYWKIMNCKREAWLLCHCSGLGSDLVLINSITTYAYSLVQVGPTNQHVAIVPVQWVHRMLCHPGMFYQCRGGCLTWLHCQPVFNQLLVEASACLPHVGGRAASTRNLVSDFCQLLLWGMVLWSHHKCLSVVWGLEGYLGT